MCIRDRLDFSLKYQIWPWSMKWMCMDTYKFSHLVKHFGKIFHFLALLWQYDDYEIWHRKALHRFTVVCRSLSCCAKGGYQSLSSITTVKFEVFDPANVTCVYQFNSDYRFILSYWISHWSVIATSFSVMMQITLFSKLQSDGSFLATCNILKHEYTV